MKDFESILEALRYIKSELPKVGEYDELFLMYCEYSEEYTVADSESDLEKKIERDWYDCGCEGSPEEHADEYKTWAYVGSERKERWEMLYRQYKPSLLSKGHIRGPVNVGGEVVASFSVSLY